MNHATTGYQEKKNLNNHLAPVRALDKQAERATYARYSQAD